MASNRDTARADEAAEMTRRAQRLGSVGVELVGAVVGVGALGWLLDWWLGTWPWLMLAGAGLGMAAGMYKFVREGLRANREFGKDR